MGRDPALSHRHPSAIINGNRYYYGKHPDPQFDYFLVEHESNGKDYWWFEEQQDLEAFLLNLPESADRNLRLTLHPDWREVTPEQRAAYFEQDKLAFRAMAQAKIASGTSPSYNMDLDGVQGPYEPQRIPTPECSESPIERVERQLREYKASHAPPERDARLPPGTLGNLVLGLMDHSFESGLSEAGKLRVLEGEIDWTGVSDEDRAAVLAREVDFTGITPEQFDFVYEDIEFDRFDPVDASVARALFTQALAAEHRADTHAARIGDHGEPDAATSNQRVREGAAKALTAGPRESWPSEIAKAQRQHSADQEQAKPAGLVQGDSNDDSHSM